MVINMTFQSVKIIDNKELELRRILGAYLKYQREFDDLSLNYVSESLNINKGYLSEVENGKRNLSYNHYDEIMDFYDIKFNFEKNILEEITIKLYEILRNYINANIVSEKEIFKEVFQDKNRYSDSYGFFVFKLIQLFYHIRFQIDNTCEIDELKELIKKYLFLYTEEEKAIFYDILAQYYIIRKKYSKSYDYLIKAREVCPDITNVTALRATILYHITIVLQRLNKPSLAFICCREAMNEFRKEKIYNRLFYLDIYEGNCLSRMQLYLEAEKVYLSVLENTFFLNDARLTCTIYDNLSWNCLKNKKYEDSIFYAKKSIELGNNSDDAYTHIAYSLFKLDKKSECIEFINNLEGDNINEFSRMLNNIILYRILNEDRKLLYELEQYYDGCKVNGDYEMELLVRNLQLDFYKEKKDFEAAVFVNNQIQATLDKNNEEDFSKLSSLILF